ncbi:hypothetical protein BDZ89DRAFT_1046632 [Hymenopellis radicata]|nr:hypothetical protein BDZ89DRAFT_1046632 [Hymenopellis radicata]
MFARLSTMVVSVLALASLVAAVPTTDTHGNGNCKTGENKCCETVDTFNNLEHSHKFEGLNEVKLLDLKALAGHNQKLCITSGLKCVNVASAGCSNQNVCCQDKPFDGVVFLGCNNINA